MSPDRTSAPSPFAARTYQEQQDRWLEWRSRQLDYRPAEAEPPGEEAPLPPVHLPKMPKAAPTRHGQLDQVLKRHALAARQAGNFRATSQTE